MSASAVKKEEEAGEVGSGKRERSPNESEEIKPPAKKLKKQDSKTLSRISAHPTDPFLANPHFKLGRERRKYVGAHVSAEGGLFAAVHNAVDMNSNAFALFLKSQRQWNFKPLVKEDAELFVDECRRFHFDGRFILPHGSYLVNLGNPDEEKRAKGYAVFLDDLKRCEELGIRLYNFHPGSSVGQCDAKECIGYIAQAINKAIKETKEVICVFENMAGQGNVIGGKFEDIRTLIEMVDDKSRVGVCLDTCHMFAAGYDIRTKEKYEETFAQFGKIVGFEYLKAMHLNDSKSDLGSKLDRHENLGKGKIGINCFRWIMNDDRFNDIPLVLETPVDDVAVYKKEIELLYSFLGEKQE